jgi:hypothetical protein
VGGNIITKEQMAAFKINSLKSGEESLYSTGHLIGA